MKEYRANIRRQAAEFGRNPDDIKVLFLAQPVIDISMEAARERVQMNEAEMDQHVDLHLSGVSRLTGIDFPEFDLPTRR